MPVPEILRQLAVDIDQVHQATSHLRRAECALLDALRTGRLVVLGRPGDAQAEIFFSHVHERVPVSYLLHDHRSLEPEGHGWLMLGSTASEAELIMQAAPERPDWGDLRFPATMLRKCFPQDFLLKNGVKAVVSGGPGRPSSMHLIKQEYLRRLASGEALASRSDEARHLFDWFQKEHRHEPSPGAKSIRNKIPSWHGEGSSGLPEIK
ncbi:hypothetical protein E0493_11160 [Roseomonas sp. M0104]|uniref:Uncharacterized protein n=1 Tax=Teichococcus coralli TaxID=2545983 RepID=A0A845BCV6_9PROT|nr:hypothetical protein [Pseudoroseomonas coralli]